MIYYDCNTVYNKKNMSDHFDHCKINDEATQQ